MIKGLTDNVPAFPRLGVLRKGAPKPERGYGRDLNYFRFDTDDAAAADTFGAAYGAEPTSINVRLPYATTEANFSAWREEWSAGGLKHRCDGETMVRWQKQDGTFSDKPKPCTGGCKPIGRLMIIIPELRRFAYVTVLTSSIHDIMTLQENLAAAELLRRDLTGIPFILSRREREISTPRGDKRVRTMKSLLSIEPAPAWVGYQLAAMERAAFTGGSYHVLTDGGIVDEGTGEIIEGEIEEELEPSKPTKTPEQVKLQLWSLLNDLVLESKKLGLKVKDAEQMQMDGTASNEEIVEMGKALREAIAMRKTEPEEAEDERGSFTEDADAELWPNGRPA